MLNKYVLELAGVLEQETVLYDEIFAISQNKTNIIVQGKVGELDNMVKLEQAMVLKLGKLEDARESLVRQITQAIGLEPEEITLTVLMEKLKGEEAKKLKDCQQALSDVIGKLKSTNDLNAKLIKNSLEYIEFSLNLMTSTNAGTNSYGSTGLAGDTKKRSLFDVKL